MDALLKSEFEQQAKEDLQDAVDVLNKQVQSGKKKVIVVDAESKRLPYTTTWFKGFQMSFEKLATMSLNQTDHKVLLLALARLEYDNYIQLTQENMATLLDLSRPQVTRSIKNLIEKGVIEKEKIGKTNFYRLRPEVAWKGRPEEFKNVVDIKSFNKKNRQHLANRNDKISKRYSPF